MTRVAIAMAAFAALGVLSWTTLSDPRIRLATLLILALFAVKTWLRRHDAGPGVDAGLDEPGDTSDEAEAQEGEVAKPM